MAVFLFPSQNIEAQTRHAPRAKVVKVHKAKRNLRQHNRRVARRTLRRLPMGTVAVVHRKVAYYPVGGMFFIARKGAFIRTFPPRGFRLRVLPRTALRLTVRERVYMFSDGLFYRPIQDEYEIVAPPNGAIVKELPEEAEEIDFEGISAYELNDAVYKTVEDGYEVIDVHEDTEE